MATEHTRTCIRDDRETEIEVTFTVESWGYPSNGWDDAGEGPEFGIDRVTLIDSETVIELTPDEEARIINEIGENMGDYEPYDDPDEYREDW